MNILVYGAGVLGSQLAQVLVRGGNDVTILARGKRAEELEREGIVIRHVFQFKTTVDPVRVTRTLEENDEYDLIFVVMKYNDFPSVLPILAANQSSNIVIVGNNPDARSMQIFLEENSKVEKRIAFGFQVSGGRRQEDRMLSIGGASGQMVIGGLDGEIAFKSILDQAFEKTKYKLNYLDDIDAWLKSHIVPILMLNAVSFNEKREMIKLDGNRKQLQHMIGAMDEGFRVLEAMGITIIPEIQAKLIRKHQRMFYLLLKIYSMLPVYKLVAGSYGEIEALNDAFTDWKKVTYTPTPHWDVLKKEYSNLK
ncbi:MULTISPECIES: ketopantoate reductase family protein [unclassified Paenibacillus]|uniref:ketopantoate reductase family protein n=1 Tax=unclassified Paenibacillus TaxID=185978 RepID=UPI000425296F|nr:MULTISPECIES: 2-dehydropantoate 2-reductase N-terminal domain-containing protein [unclassified Paenibacillus]KGP78550.1 2-dehydropantoate 2-reductase [Paenibacillus sp. MAEPY2]KGP86517.1 2-dehydropantoate 2-reductase [Paenibacillus sp. MAEPY1]